MKYWTELSKMEEQIIRLSSLESTLRTIACGIPHTSLEDAECAIWHLAGSIEDIHKNLRYEFDELWETVRDEDDTKYDEELIERVKHKGGMKKKKQMTDRELP